MKRFTLIAAALVSIAIAWSASALYAQVTQPGFFSRLQLGSAGATKLSVGTGSPESAVTGAVGDVFIRTDGANCTTIYLKDTGTGNTGWATRSTPSCTETLTNKTVNAESTGNVVTLPFTLFVQAGACITGGNVGVWDLATPAPAYGCVTDVSNGPLGSLDYDDSSFEYANNHFRLPSDWTGAIDLALYWETSATTGNAVWQIQTACIADDESSDASWNTVQTITDAAKATAKRLNVATLTSVTTTGCAAGEMFKYRIGRDPAHASDTIAATAKLIEVEWTYRRAM